MKNNEKLDNALKAISKDRQRTNMLRRFEQRAIAYLVQRMPLFVSSNMLTGIGFLGNLILALSFVFGAIYSPYFLLFGIIGSFINWFGDSLDGRLAYYRNKPRKWYGFTLDIIGFCGNNIYWFRLYVLFRNSMVSSRICFYSYV